MNYERLNNESFDEYCHRISSLKDQEKLSWYEIADIINEVCNLNHSESYYRKKEKYLQNNPAVRYETETLQEEPTTELAKIKVRLSDERTQINALIRRLSREDTIKEIAKAAVADIENRKFLSTPSVKVSTRNEKVGLLLIGDWHYGIDVDNIYNVYNPKVALKRISQLKDEVISKCQRENISKLYVANLGDMISGNIHLPLRINTQVDVISQTMQVSEIVAEFISDLSTKYEIEYHSVVDNHSRITPNKKESIALESLCRITDWYLKERLRNNSNFIFVDNVYGIDIATINIFNHNIACVHGDKDKQQHLIEKINNFTRNHFDLICTAHLHHFSADETCNTLMVCNGSLMGTDDYAFDLRLNSAPSQTLIFISKNNVMESLHRIVLD